MSDDDLFGYAARQAKHDGITTITKHRPTDVHYVRRAIVKLAYLRTEFTSDDVRRVLAEWGYIILARNVIGAAFSGAASQGVIEPVGYTTAKNKSTHARVVRVWRGV